MTLKKAENLNIGKRGEDIARRHLEKKGYCVIEQNYRTKYSEMDLIATKDGVLVFIEVRTKTSERFGAPEDTINKQKIARLIRSAKAYLAYKKHEGPARIDAVCVVLGQEEERINHYESIT